MGIIVKCYPFGMQKENTYLITDEATGQKAVLDPGYFGADIAAEIGDRECLRYILLTHGHYDHFSAAQDYIDEYPSAVFAAPAGETYLMHGGRDNKWMALGNGSPVCPEADVLLKEGDSITLGDTVLKVMETPGHTEGGIVFHTGLDAFTGDTLFRLSVGNTSLETGDKVALVRSIHSRLYALDDETVIWPGHGASSTIGYEKRNNPFVPAPVQTLIVPEGTEVIGNRYYSGRTDFREVLLPESVRDMGVAAFAGCASLEKISLPAGMSRIRKELFSGCTSLKEVIIPQGVTTIGEWAFRSCRSLGTVKIPGSVTEIAAEAFLECPSLRIAAEKGSYAEKFALRFGIPLAE